MIFDEIDANIGGETATLVGQKLKAMGNQSQIIAITHFPQVARYADHHLQISKKEVNGRTLTEIHPLKSTEKETELLRAQELAFRQALDLGEGCGKIAGLNGGSHTAEHGIRVIAFARHNGSSA